MHIHESVLDAANAIGSRRRDWTFTVAEVVAALPHLNKNSVQTHVVSRCCVNAPKNHLHKWGYFRRVGRGRYQVEARHRARPTKIVPAASPNRRVAALRRTLHAIIQQDEGAYVAECLELPIVSQGSDLDEAVANFREALALHLEGEDLAAMGFVSRPDLQIIYEVPAA